jgi:hypothetical protein
MQKFSSLLGNLLSHRYLVTTPPFASSSCLRVSRMLLWDYSSRNYLYVKEANVSSTGTCGT